MKNYGPPIALAVVSATSIAFQLSMVQIFSFTQWYHFAFLVISIALLGGGMAGTMIHLWQEPLVRRYEVIFPLCLALAAGGMIVSIYLTQWEPLRFDSFLIFTGFKEGVKLPLTYLILLMPFFFSALAIGLLITKEHKYAGRVYFWNLCGSGIGATLGWGLMWFLPAELFPPLLSSLNILVCLLCLPKKGKYVITGTLGLVALLAVPAWMWPPKLVLSQYKDLSRILHLPLSRVEEELSSPYGRLHLVKAPLVRYAPGISLSFPGQPPSLPLIFLDGNGVGPLFSFSTLRNASIHDYTLAALPWSIKKARDVLVLSRDGGIYAAYALYRGARNITVVNPNPVLTRLIAKNLPVCISTADHRSWLEKDEKTYDLVYFPVLGSWGGNAGVNAVAEDHLFTAEGVRRAFEKLNPQGMMVFLLWEDYPTRYPLKLFATLTQGLQGRGALYLVRGMNQLALVIKKSPFTAEERGKLTAFSEGLQFEELSSSAWEKDGRDYPFDIAPATDDRPYIHQFLRPRSLPVLARYYGWERVPFFEVGYLIVFITLAQVVVIAASFIFLPLLTSSFRPRGVMKVFLYFAGIGLGYMLAEMAFIQRFVFYFGSTINSLTMIVALMLVSSGLGSLATSRGFSNLQMVIVPCFIILILGGLSVFLTPTLISTAGYPWGARLALTVVFVSFVSFLMGMPFPMGIKWLGKKVAGFVPWAWGVNGFFSVLGACLATVVSVEVGFRALLWAAAIAYAGTLPLSFYFGKSN